MIQPNTVITGDSLTILRNMEPESVDMVITDPPYGIDYQSGRKEKDRRLAKISNDKAPFIWWIYDAARVLKSRGGCSVLAAGTSSRYSSTRCASPA
jgi:site-specific DNA-methyltransferase (adenine-specific)